MLLEETKFIPLIDRSSPGVDQPYPVFGGFFREEAILLLRRFYVQENEKGTPTPQYRCNCCFDINEEQPLNLEPRNSESSRRRSYPWFEITDQNARATPDCTELRSP